MINSKIMEITDLIYIFYVQFISSNVHDKQQILFSEIFTGEE